jgi:septum formation protein
MKFVLASSSPRRRELLGSIGLDFEIVPSHVPEIHQRGETPEEYVARLSRDKAGAVADTHPSQWVIAADTTVIFEDELLEKPVDEADAVRMLEIIAGRTHTVFTAVTLKNRERDYLDTHVTSSEVRMLPLTRAEIEWYVQTGEPLDKAGAYAAQGIGAIFIESIHGSYSNVVGLPLATLYQMLRKAGIDPLHQSERS